MKKIWIPAALITVFVIVGILISHNMSRNDDQIIDPLVTGTTTIDDGSTSEPSDSINESVTGTPVSDAKEETAIHYSSACFDELSDDIYSYQLMIDGIVYQFPMSYSEFTSKGWVIDEIPNPEDSMLDVDYYDSFNFRYGDMRCLVDVVNLGINAVPIKEALVAGISFSANDLEKAKIEAFCPGGFQIGVSTTAELVNFFGEPSHSSESSKTADRFTLRYEEDLYSEYVFTSDSTNVISNVKIRNFVTPECFDYGTVIDEIPTVVSTYVKPKEIPDDMFQFVVSIDGDLYDFPCPAIEFINNGWRIVSERSDKYVVGSGFGRICLMKNNKESSINVVNKSPNTTSIEYCYVDNWVAGSSSLYCDLPMEISGDIKYGDTITEVKKKLDDMELSYEDEGDTLKVRNPHSTFSSVRFDFKGEEMRSMRIESD